MEEKTRARATPLIAQLGDSSLETRESAQAALLGLGWRISWKLDQAYAQAEDPEVCERLRILLQKFGCFIREP